jgi:hypothetical protein
MVVADAVAGSATPTSARPARAVEGGVLAVGLPPAGVTTFAIGG